MDAKTLLPLAFPSVILRDSLGMPAATELQARTPLVLDSVAPAAHSV